MSHLISTIENKISQAHLESTPIDDSATMIKYIRMALVIHPDDFSEVIDSIEAFIEKNSKKAENIKSYSIKNGVITILNGSVLPKSKPFLPPWRIAEMLGFEKGTRQFRLAIAYLMLPENRVLANILI